MSTRGLMFSSCFAIAWSSFVLQMIFNPDAVVQLNSLKCILKKDITYSVMAEKKLSLQPLLNRMLFM